MYDKFIISIDAIQCRLSSAAWQSLCVIRRCTSSHFIDFDMQAGMPSMHDTIKLYSYINFAAWGLRLRGWRFHGSISGESTVQWQWLLRLAAGSEASSNESYDGRKIMSIHSLLYMPIYISQQLRGWCIHGEDGGLACFTSTRMYKCRPH